MNLLDLLRFYGLPSSCDVKAYQHVDHGTTSIQDMIDDGSFEHFQSCHSGDVLGRGYVASFVKEPAGATRFLGMWKVISETKEVVENQKRKVSWYGLEKVPAFDELIDRLVIQWPPGRVTHRWVCQKHKVYPPIEVEQIRPSGYLGPFPGFDQLVLSHRQLAALAQNQGAGASWVAALRSIRAVYLITEIETGALYVGSATGAQGLWGRWQAYAADAHGGNKMLIDAVDEIEAYAERLQFSVLETLSNLATRDDGLVAEQRWKRKLGKRATILNAN